jgi:membrane-bound lytic murein transglycosylase D
VKPGDSPASIAKKYEIRASRLYNYNDISRTTELEPGTNIYLQPKRKKGETRYHIAREGESMAFISQKYGISLKHLCDKNKVSTSFMPATGERIHLRKKRSDPPKAAEKRITQKKSNPISKEHVTPAPEVVDQKNLTNINTNTEKQVESTKENSSDKKSMVESGSVKTTMLSEDNPRSTISNQGDIENNIIDSEPESISAGSNKIAENEVISEGTENQIIQEKSGFYIVKPGDTFYAISKKLNLSAEDLRKWNGMEGNSLSIGQVLKTIDPETMVVPEKDGTGKQRYHEVLPGETLYGISKKYNVSVENIKKWNSMESNEIKIGTQLIVFNP